MKNLDKKQTILNEIIEHYTKSADFKGLPSSELKIMDKNSLCELIDEGKIDALPINGVLNPFIKLFNIPEKSRKRQKEAIRASEFVILYPTKESLKSTPKIENKPYSTMLKKGAQHLKLIFFNIEILDTYFKNPKYSIYDAGYKGSIILKDEYVNENLDAEYIKKYGMAYKNVDHLERAIAVFLTDLYKLDSKTQGKWKFHELENQDQYHPASDFMINAIKGEWAKNVWIFDALLKEMQIINQQCVSMKIPPLFKKTYNSNNLEKPDGYQSVLLPTTENYFKFVITLEKLIVQNISIDTFQASVFGIKKIERFNDSDNPKPSLQMLDEWLNTNNICKIGNNKITEEIVQPLKQLRKIRQIPAHEEYENEYNVKYYDMQKELMENTYAAIRNIRLIFSNHPVTRDIEIPDYLNGPIIFH